jgi:voltage-gated potassium channel
LYWAFITATTVGYGDIRPKGRLSRFLSVMIAFVGLIFTGIMVSVAVEVTSYSFKKHGHIAEAKRELGSLEKS